MSNPTINLNDKSKVKNLCSHDVSWKRETLAGDEFLKSNAVVYIVNSEIETQVQNGRKEFVGIGNGDHAQVFIDNPDMREYLGFDNKEEKRIQFVLDDKKCKELLDIKDFKVFEERINEDIIARHEKIKLMTYARKVKLNDYAKIQFLEQYCNIKFNG